MASLMEIIAVRAARTAHPTGDPSFAVKQCMPGAFAEAESDPFLMCDEFGPTVSTGAHGDDSDEGFDVAWHPHHGMDILSYMVEGNGRHADSLGNRETFRSPGFQWLSVGSGIEHAEGGGTPKGERTHGFQIWLRMPISKMEDDPRYGIVNPEEIPVVKLAGGIVRVVSGSVGDVLGPARFAVTVQILDVELEPGSDWAYERPENMDNVIFYCFKGSAVVNGGTALKAQHAARFQTSASRSATLTAGSDGYRGMVFAGKMTKENIVWHGPFVASSRSNLQNIFKQYQEGGFPPKRASWDYKDIRKKPA
eukprot:TRINITY_DN31548_c0_g1_i1.p1 TRINITY_DN31548_c0_g1~~TRINITY_DN31548_c0_g1_i1.p1  ORF type:complete len:308 (-),score=46.09 TRINITY_DN31548_c0_g1_i1:47-970(-)